MLVVCDHVILYTRRRDTRMCRQQYRGAVGMHALPVYSVIRYHSEFTATSRIPSPLTSTLSCHIACPATRVPPDKLTTFFRLLEEQEREERSKEESLRLLRSSEETTDASSSQDSSGTSTTAATARRAEREANSLGSVGALGDIEIPQLRQEENAELRSHPSPRGSASEHSSFGDRFASMEDGGVNFEDEFDPILASIRKPQQPPASTTAGARSMSPRGRPTAVAAASPPSGGERGREANDTGRSTTGSSFAAGFLSMLPGDMRAKAGEVMAQSSARISESANAFRSALGPGGAAQAATDKSKRRQSGPTYRGVDGGDPELEEGRGDGDDVRLMNVNEVLSEEEVRAATRDGM